MSFSWKILLKKVGKHAIYIALAGIAATYGSSPYYIAIAPALVGLENYLKHRKD